MVDRGIGKEGGADVDMSAPQAVAYDFAAAEVVDFKAEMAIAFICFEQRGVRKGTEILSHTKTQKEKKHHHRRRHWRQNFQSNK